MREDEVFVMNHMTFKRSSTSGLSKKKLYLVSLSWRTHWNKPWHDSTRGNPLALRPRLFSVPIFPSNPYQPYVLLVWGKSYERGVSLLKEEGACQTANFSNSTADHSEAVLKQNFPSKVVWSMTVLHAALVPATEFLIRAINLGSLFQKLIHSVL